MVKFREFGLIGRGIGHSFSASFFNDKFSQEAIEAEYVNFDLTRISQLTDILDSHPDLRGLNVTSPYKREVIPFLQDVSEDARQLNAVNVIKIDYDETGKRFLRGFNTDWKAFRDTLQPFKEKVSGALILGTGGAASAVGMALSEEGIPYMTVSRNPSGSNIGYDMANALLDSFNFVINATPAGMHPDNLSVPPIDFDKITPNHFFYDLIYNPAETRFLTKAAGKGAQTFNGFQMLLNQALRSWDIWNS